MEWHNMDKGNIFLQFYIINAFWFFAKLSLDVLSRIPNNGKLIHKNFELNYIMCIEHPNNTVTQKLDMFSLQSINSYSL